MKSIFFTFIILSTESKFSRNVLLQRGRVKQENILPNNQYPYFEIKLTSLAKNAELLNITIQNSHIQLCSLHKMKPIVLFHIFTYSGILPLVDNVMPPRCML